MSADLNEAVDALRRMIGEQDYTLRTTVVDESSVDIAVSARDAACEECLVPKEMMRSIADDCLSGTGYRLRTLTYPGEEGAGEPPWRFVAAATAHEAGGKIGALPAALHPVGASVLCGPAFTVLCGARDNLALHHAIAKAPAGSVLVCQTGGEPEAGYVGEVMVRAAIARGLAGLVIDGCVRDAGAIRALGWPVFARGLNVRGTTKDPLLPQALGCRLRFGDVDVDPGDLVLGDADGVVVLPSERIAEVLTASEAREAAEKEIFARIAAGETTVESYGLPPHGGQPG
jgi:4-hydroxy-4-methyl-2-oxoglutarate aldolase